MEQPSPNRPSSRPVEPTPRRSRLWSAEEVATFLGMTPRWVRKAAAANRLPSVRLPGTRVVRFDATAVRAWAAGHAHRLTLARSSAARTAANSARRENGPEPASAAPATVPRRSGANKEGS